MVPLNACSHSSPHLQWGRIQRSNVLQVAVKPLNRTLNGAHIPKARTDCFQGLRKIDCITNKSDKSFTGKYVRVSLANGNASEFEGDGDSTKFQNLLWKNIKAFYTFLKPYTLLGALAQAMGCSLFAVQTFGDLSPTLFVGILKASVPFLLMVIYNSCVNHLSDIEIDKINKPYSPVASGDFSTTTGLVITCVAFSLSLGMAIMLSPPLFIGLFIVFLAGSAYSIDLPLLRWKKHPFLEATSAVLMFLAAQFGFFMHIQKYVLRKPPVFTKSFIFATAINTFFPMLFAILKDIPDVEGDKAFGIQTLSVQLGKEYAFWLCVKMMLLAYGAAVVVGATSSSLLSRLVTIIGHCLLATFMLFQAQSVDLTNKTSTTSFYMLAWKLYCVEHFLIPFVR